MINRFNPKIYQNRPEIVATAVANAEARGLVANGHPDIKAHSAPPSLHYLFLRYRRRLSPSEGRR